MSSYKKIGIQMIRKMIREEGLKGKKELKGYSYRRKKDLVEVLEKMNIPESTLEKYRKKKTQNAKKPAEKKKIPKNAPPPTKMPNNNQKSETIYILKHIHNGKVKIGKTYRDLNKAIAGFNQAVRTKDEHSKCYLVMKKGGKERIIKSHNRPKVMFMKVVNMNSPKKEKVEKKSPY